MTARTTQRLDPAPFRAWADRCLASPVRAKDAIGEFAGQVSEGQLADDLGMNTRMLHRWRFENQTLDRIEVEECLDRMDVPMTEVYPDLEEWPELRGQLGPPPGFGSKLTDDQVRVLHRLHTEREFSIREIARRVYRSVGYATPGAAEFGIRRGFQRLCLDATWRHASTLPVAASRRCTDTKTNGDPCEAFAVEDSGLCWTHANRELARKRIAVANEARLAVAA